MIEYVAPDEREHFLQHILPALQTEGRWKGEVGFYHFRNRTTIPAYYNAFLVRNMETGEPLALAATVRDISDMKQAEAERAALQQQVIEAQRDALRELSTPLMPIADGVLAMPLIGTIDSGRAQQVLETLLEGVATHQAQVAILDITGVQVIDTQVADALIRAARAVKLLGAQAVLTGIQPRIAQTLVHLGVDLSSIVTRSSLQSGIAYALKS
jgi:rsbT co-antagonist protein RsbR